MKNNQKNQIEKPYELILGDCIPIMQDMAEQGYQFDLSVYSPPFASLYTYTNKNADMGNSRDSDDEFLIHHKFFVRALLPLIKEGRNVCVHVQNPVRTKNTNGYMGIHDLRGDIIRQFIDEGFIYYGEATIDKNPQALRNGTRVLTPNAWVTIEDLKEGDFVIGSDGTPTKVMGVYPHGVRQMYRVQFGDEYGCFQDCDENHLWSFYRFGLYDQGLITEDICRLAKYNFKNNVCEVPALSEFTAFENYPFLENNGDIPKISNLYKKIDSITPVDKAECTCIAVEAEDGLFVIENFILTHNSQAIRTKSHQLMFISMDKDGLILRPALADYLLVFKKPGDNKVQVRPDIVNHEMSGEDWIRWASPVWYQIKETNTLNVRLARSDKDERHLCPLQLDFIERCVKLFSNPGETVFSPFAGIGSEGYVSLAFGRKFVGVELKEEYYNLAKTNLEDAIDLRRKHENSFTIFEEREPLTFHMGVGNSNG